MCFGVMLLSIPIIQTASLRTIFIGVAAFVGEKEGVGGKFRQIRRANSRITKD